MPTAPSTRRLAREKGVDLHDIEPSGEHGRVTAEDVEAAAQTAAGQKEDKGDRRRGGSALIPGGGEPPTLPDFRQWGETCAPRYARSAARFVTRLIDTLADPESLLLNI